MSTNRNLILAAMVVSMVLGYLPWYNFSAVQQYIAAEYMLTARDVGVILAAFQAGYVALVPIAGYLGDRVGASRTVFWATLATGIFSTVFALGKWSKTGVLILRMLTGLTAGAIYVPGLSLLSRWFPQEKRGNILGAYTAALVAAYAGGYFVAAPLAAKYGWRTGILWTSLPAFVAAAVVALLVKDPPVPSADRFRPHPIKPLQKVSGAAVDPAPRGGFAGPLLLTVAYIGHMWEQYAFWGWLGPFLVAVATAAGMGPNESALWGGRTAALVILLGAPASWIWGMMADRKGRTWAIAVAAGLSLMGEMILGSLVGRSLVVVVAVAAWIGFWVVADSAVYKAALIEMTEVNSRGLYLGLQSAVGYVVTIVAPVVFGKVLEASNGAVPTSQMRVWAPAFVALGAGALVAPVGAMLLRATKQALLMGSGKK